MNRAKANELTNDNHTWNLTLGTGYRFYENFWLYADVGLAGFRGVTIEGEGSEDRLDSQPSLVFSLAIQFRP